MTKRLGSYANAQTAASIRGYVNLPDGWKYISSGSYRDAYLGPDGVVYKVQHYSDMRDDPFECNRDEAERFAEFGKEATEGFRLAACRIFKNGVLAMEHVPIGNYTADRWTAVSGVSNRHRAARAAREWARMKFDAYDVMGDNYLVHAETGELVIVDYAT